MPFEGIITIVCFVVALLDYANGQCEYVRDGYRLQWSHNSSHITFQLMATIDTMRWTGVAFGDNMSDLDLIELAVLDNGLPILTDKTVRGYTPSSIMVDVPPSVSLLSSSYVDRTLIARFVRPIQAKTRNTKSLSQCSVWQFPTNGGQWSVAGLGKHSATPLALNVCPQNCRGSFNTFEMQVEPPSIAPPFVVNTPDFRLLPPPPPTLPPSVVATTPTSGYDKIVNALESAMEFVANTFENIMAKIKI